MFNDNDFAGNAPPLPPEESSGVDAASLLEVGSSSEEDQEKRELRTFVGPRNHYYLKKWAPALWGSGKMSGFNIGAFFFAGNWLAYRKMYWAATVFWVIIMAESILEDWLFIRLGFDEVPSGMTSLVGMVAAVICGALGNRWYLSHTQKVVANVRAEEGQDSHRLLSTLSKRGGTSIGAALAFLVVFLVSFFTVFMFSEYIWVKSHGTCLEFGNNEIYYTGDATAEDARKLAEIFEKDGIFDSTGISVKLAASSGKYTISFIVSRSSATPFVVKPFESVGYKVVEGGFPAPLTIQLCNSYFVPHKTIEIYQLNGPQED